MQAKTRANLESLGISFAANSPIAAKPGHGLQDPTNGALFCDGVLFTNAVDKGDVLDSFLGNLVFGSALAELAANKGSRPAGLPPAIYFADDRPEVRVISSSSVDTNAAACGARCAECALCAARRARRGLARRTCACVPLHGRA